MMADKYGLVAINESREELEKLFNDEFMGRNTNFSSFEEFRFSGAVFVNWDADFIVAPREAFDRCVRGKTRFKSWEEMYKAAMKQGNNFLEGEKA
jgi:hypothetical protein